MLQPRGAEPENLPPSCGCLGQARQIRLSPPPIHQLCSRLEEQGSSWLAATLTSSSWLLGSVLPAA